MPKSISLSLILGLLASVVLPALAATSQVAVPATLPGTLREHVKNERFEVVTSIRGLPLGVRDGLQLLFGSHTLDIAESSAEVQGPDVIGTPKRPLRRLVAAGCSIDHCLVFYERGGRERAWLAALFHWTPAQTRFEWGGHTRGGMATIGDVRNAVLSGAVTGPVTRW